MPPAHSASQDAPGFHPGRATRLLLVGLTAFVAATALLGGLLLTLRPDGGALGLTTGMLAGSVFPDYLVPGLVLLLLGLVHAAAGWLVGHERRAAWIAAGVAGASLVGYEFAEWTIVGTHWLQVLYTTVGVLIGLLAFTIVPAHTRAHRADDA